jgi:hypothetical protein
MEDWSSVEEFDVKDDLNEIYVSPPKEIHNEPKKWSYWDRAENCLFQTNFYSWLRLQYLRFIRLFT